MPRLSRHLSLRTLLFGAAVLTGCMGIDDPRALDEAIVVHQGNFKSGKLPGSKQASSQRPAITSLEVGTGELRPGAVNVPLLGRATLSAYSIGVRLLGQGTGYWVHTTGAEDVLTPGDRTWELSFDVGEDVEPGPYLLGAVAFDEKGRAGQQSTVEVCVQSDLPDLGNVCDPKREPPAAITALRWNTDADLDLIVIAPDGTRYGRSNFSQVVNEEVVARLDADASSNCLLDGRRIENFVWTKRPQKGTWFIYANLFDACQKSAVSFELTTYRSKKHMDGTFSLVEEKSVGGEFLRAQSKADATKPLYLTKIEFP